jgi:hypothetical protein
MDENLHNTELWLRYLDGELDQDEKQKLEQQLAADELLRSELEQLKVSIAAIRYHGIQQQVAAVHQEVVKQKSSGKVAGMRSRVRSVLAVAASVLIIILGASIFYIAGLSNDKVYNEAYVDFTLSASRSGDTTSAINEAYAVNDFNNVIALSKTKASLSDQQKLLVGISNLKIGNYTDAIAQLADVTKSNTSYKSDGEFYLAMSYLKVKNYDAALSIMKKIHDDPNHLYHERITDKQLREVRLLKWK